MGRAAGVVAVGPMRTVSGLGALGRHLAARNLPGLVGLVLLAGVLATAVLPSLVTRHSPDSQDIEHRLQPPVWDAEGSPEYLLGTDQLGRDMLARLAYGGRVSLLVGGIAVGLAGPIGLVLGIVAGYYGGKAESLAMGMVDVVLSVPFVLVAIVLAAVAGPGLRNVLIVLTITGWVVFARVVHSQTLSIKNSEFIEAARAIGAGEGRILRRHILPHVLGPFVVVAILQVGRMMLAEAALSFLGLGVEPSRPSWGTMLGVSRDYIWTASWLITFPGLAITVTVLATSLLGDWLRLSIDPRLRAASRLTNG